MRGQARPMHEPADTPREAVTWRDSVPAWLGSVLFHAAVLLLLALVTLAARQMPERDVVLEIGRLTPSGDASGAGGQLGDDAADPEQGVADAARLSSPAEAQQVAPTPAPLATPAIPTPEADALDAPTADPALALVTDLAETLSPGAAGAGSGGLLEGTSPGFQRMIGGLRGHGLDVAFVIDATGSMGPYIEQAKARLRQIVGVITGILELGGAAGPRADVRFGVVAFKDYGDGYGMDATIDLPLTRDLDSLIEFVDRIHAGGGGDEPEPIDMALSVATDPDRMGWQRRRRGVIILIGDAPVHPGGRDDAVTLAARFHRRFRGTVNALDVGRADTAGRSRRAVLRDFEQIASAGHGSAMLLSDPRQVRAFWRYLIVSVFGRQYEHDVQLIVDRYADRLDTPSD